MFSPLDSPKALSSHQIDLNSQIKNSDLEAPQEEKVSSICTSLFMKINDLQIVRNNQLKNLDTLKKRFNLINQKKISEIQKIKKLKNEGFFQKLKRLFSNSVKKDIELINKNIKNLNNAQSTIEKNIEVLLKEMQEINTNEKTVNDLRSILENIQNDLTDFSFKDVNDARMILELESHFRSVLEFNFPIVSDYHNYYEQILTPLIANAKAFLATRPASYAAAAAARKGEAALKGISAVQKIAETFGGLEANQSSAQMVVVRPDLGAVIKESTKRAKEESALVSNLLSLMTKGGVLGSASLKLLSPLSKLEKELAFRNNLQVGSRSERLSVSDQRELQRRINIKELDISSPALDKIINLLPEQERKILGKYRDLKISNDSIATKNWHILDQLTGRIKKTSFDEIKEIYNNPKTQNQYDFGICNRIGTFYSMPKLIHQFIKDEKNESLLSINLTPDLKNPNDLKIYEACEKCKWKLSLPGGKTQIVDFKTLHLAYLESKNGKINYTCVKSLNAPSPSKKEITQALNSTWKIDSSSKLFKITDRGPAPLLHAEIKPYVEMDLMSKILKSQRLTQAISTRLNSDSQYKALLIGLLQCYDLHTNNIGLAPVPNEAFDYFSDTNFLILSNGKNKPIHLRELQKKYLKGEISDSTVIQYEKEGKKVKNTIGNLNKLKQALETEWEYVFFDLDLSIGESNHLLSIQERHMIPFRSGLLENSAFRDAPLSDEIINKLISPEWSSSVDDWIQHKDAPIKYKMSQEMKEYAKNFFNPAFEKFNLSQPQFRFKNHEDLRHYFAESICNPLNKEWADYFSPFWVRMEEDLNRLNPSKKIDLTSNDSPEIIKHKMKIAAQFFPRLTHLEQKCFNERKNSIKNYLSSFKKIKHTEAQGDALSNELEECINSSFIPLSTARREEFIQNIKDAKNNTETLRALRDQLCKDIQPTYFNVAKSMYPLLADVFRLNQGMRKEIALELGFDQTTSTLDKLPGFLIGNYIFPIEKTFALAKSKYRNPKNPEHALVLNIEKKIRSGELSSYNMF